MSWVMGVWPVPYKWPFGEYRYLVFLEVFSRALLTSIKVSPPRNSKMADVSDKTEYGTLGQEVQIEHIKAYFVKPSGGSDKAVLLGQDIYGWKSPSNRYLADMLAANGYMTVCPDFFVGKEPWGPANDWSKMESWLSDKKPTQITKEVDAVMKFLKEQGAKRIGVVGMNWGGVAAHVVAMQYPDVKAAVSVYGFARYTDNVHGIKCPTLFLFGEKDTIIPLDESSAFEAKLKEKCSMDFQVKVFPGQTHGFFNRKREDISPADKPKITEARKDAINWLNKFM